MAIVWNGFTYDNKYFVDALNGDDASGDGIKKPFKTLSKLLQVIPKDKNSLIKLEDGEYTFGRDISDGFANCRVTILGNKARTTLKQIVGLYSGNNTGGSYTFTLEFVQLLFTMNAALTQYNLNNYGFHWNMYNVVMANIPSNDYSVFLPGGGSLKLYNCINISLTRNLLRNDWGIIELTNCYGAFTSGYNTHNNSWDKSNNIITSTPTYDSEYIIPYDGIGVYFGEFAWRINNFLIQTDKGQYLSFENNSGVRMVSHIPIINERYFAKYGINKITKKTLKNNYDKVRLVSNKESNVNEGKTFEHEIDLKNYEVNKISLANVEGKSLLQSKGGLYHSILDTVGIKYIPNADEQTFINHGMGKSSVIDFEAEFTQKSLIKTESSVLGDGKVFKQKIDTSKIPIKKVSIK
ncbi:hypothetical protein QJQ58_00280 [Paenibacillus dendritiformis]|uniref:hypothetical protein n=1 Tax=Paenibacillus dendritiformis TaxID=130049 RepID=UPI00248C688E|nr:hypothetical protein [Paenibacillus dendritiformis]WGU94753.1 hypothetical protein QJQ58_00280 [Paenibacillus dendritiformis]